MAKNRRVQEKTSNESITRKLSLKQRLNSIRKLSTLTIVSKASNKHDRVATKKATLETTKELNCTDIVAKIIDATYTDLACPHVLVGASNVYDLLQSNVGIEKTHSVLGWRNKNGDYAEAAFIQSGVNVQKYFPSGRSSRLPFLVATGDFVIEEADEKICVEIKSRSSREEAQQQLSKTSLIQLWATMDILQLKKGRLLAYHFHVENNMVSTCQLVGQVDIVRKISFIDTMALTLINGYTTFLRSYYIALTKQDDVEVSDMNAVNTLLHKHFDTAKDTISLDLSPLVGGEECRAYARRSRDFNRESISSVSNHSRRPINYRASENEEKVMQSAFDARPFFNMQSFLSLPSKQHLREKTLRKVHRGKLPDTACEEDFILPPEKLTLKISILKKTKVSVLPSSIKVKNLIFDEITLNALTTMQVRIPYIN